MIDAETHGPQNVSLLQSIRGVHGSGRYPEHWEVRRLGSLTEMRVSNVDKRCLMEGDEVPVYRLCN